MKHLYLVPSIKVVSFKVEDGFTSPRRNLNVGVLGDSEANPPITPTEGSEAFGFGSIFAQPTE